MLVIKKFREIKKILERESYLKISCKEVFSAGNGAVFIGRKTQWSLGRSRRFQIYLGAARPMRGPPSRLCSGEGIYGEVGVEFCGGEEDEKELVEMGEVGEGPFGEVEGGVVVAGVDRDGNAEKEET
ncbi:hypothetical protein Tco_1351472 [Tanacetum coccineum]